MRNRTVYAIMAVVGIGALAGLWVMVQGDPDAPEPPKPSRGSEYGTVTKTGFGGPGHGPAGRRPDLPQVGSAGSADAPPTEYAVNGAIVRDRRTGNRPPFEPNADIAPPNKRKLQPTLTKAIADRVRDVMHECVKDMPREARGERPRLEGTINIAIKAQQVSVSRAELRVRDVAEAAAERTRQCIVQKSQTITHAAADEADLESYDINLSFTLI